MPINISVSGMCNTIAMRANATGKHVKSSTIARMSQT